MFQEGESAVQRPSEGMEGVDEVRLLCVCVVAFVLVCLGSCAVTCVCCCVCVASRTPYEADTAW